jgi:hypothetical protein
MEPNDASGPSSAVRQPVLLGLFAGTAVGGGYLLAGVPNVEVMSLITAVAGVVLGPVRGFVAGALAAAVYSLGSPYGLPAPLLLVAQMAGLGSAGPIGWLAAGRRPAGRSRSPLHAPVRAAAGGLAITVIHDALTNLAILGMLDLPPGVVLAGAVPFFLIHAGSNLVIFPTLLPVLATRLAPLARPRVTGRPGPLALVAGLGLASLLGTAASPVRAQPLEDALPLPVLADSTAATAMDSIAAAAADTNVAADTTAAAATNAAAAQPPAAPPAAAPLGWRRPLWTPFFPSFLAWTEHSSPWLPSVDGGVGASARLTGEAGTSPLPLVVRDGVPLGTGHAMADDPWLVGIEGVEAASGGLGADGWGGTGGVVELTSRDADPKRTTSSYRGIKGDHETYYRGLDFLSPRADWRVGFDFEESLDNAGYNHTLEDDDSFARRRDDGLTGQGKVRQSRTRLMRSFADGSGLVVEFGNGRRTRDDLPALDAGSLEAWDRSASVRMRWLAGGWDLRPAVWSSERDVQWGGRWSDITPPTDLRLLESGRQGVRFEIRRRGPVAAGPAPAAAADTSTGPAVITPTGSVAAPADGLPLLSVSTQAWSLRDSGTDLAWAGADTGAISGRGDELRVALGWEGDLAGAHARTQLAALAGGGLDVGPDVMLGLSQRPLDPRWRLAVEWGGRAPRSDELLTPMRYSVDGRKLVVLPESGLEREQTARAALDMSARALGLDLAVDASARRLEGGISWHAAADDPDRGRWANELDLTAWRLTARASHAGRFLGWARVAAEGTWQGFDVTGGQAGALPPEQWQRLRVDWENHFFSEDGILQISLLSTRRSEAADPWDVTGTYLVPARTNHDLLVGFRLVGVHLALGLRNLTDQRQQLTSGAWSPGFEWDSRVEWHFPY